jgi:glycosyltransferase involved in cell wall biosynthesis
MLYIKLKRDVYSLYLALQYFRHKRKKHYPKCFAVAAQIEYLESHISYGVASFLFSLLRNKYEVSECGQDCPYINSIVTRFTESSRSFLQNDLLFIKPYISEQEKGVLMVKYTEVVNAIPFLFDLHKLQQRYHLVLEQSSESPFQPFNAFIPNDSLVFIQSVSERERVQHRKHGFIPVPLTSGDWVNKHNFYPDHSIVRKYDFCVISNFIPLKRYPFLFSALKKHWKGPLKIAIVASGHVGENRQWMERLLEEYGFTDNAEIFIEIPPAQVNMIMNQSYCHVMCSMREGSPKVNFESMITGTPVVIHRDHLGFSNWKFKAPMVINYTGEDDIVNAIKQCAKADKKEVADLASKMIGSARATDVLNKEIKEAALKHGEKWTKDIFEKVNNVHTFYANKADVESCLSDYHYLQSCANSFFGYNADEVIELFRNN